MTDEKLSVKKTCISCGLEKPFSAFLQLGGTEGAIYGNICSDCRKTSLKTKSAKEQDDSTTVASGDRIDAKFKVHQATQIEKSIEEKDENKKLEKEKNKKESALVSRKMEITEKSDKNRRQNLKEKFFLSDKKSSDKAIAMQHREKTEENNKTEAIKEEEKQKSVDFRNSFIPPQTNLEKFNSPTFKAFKDWLGESSPIVNSLNASKISEQKLKEKSKVKNILEEIEKNWKPTSRGR